VTLAAVFGFLGLARLLPRARVDAQPGAPAAADRKLDMVLERLERIEQRLDEIERHLTANRYPIGDTWIPRGRIRSFSDMPTEEVVVEWNGGWWPASPVEGKGEKTLVRFKGWDASWNEWVGKERIRYLAVPAAPRRDQEVLVQWNSVWLPAVVAEVKGDRVQLSPRNAGSPPPRQD
jgi:hypothetical protein